MKKVFKHNDFTATVEDEGGYFSITGECGGGSGAIGDRVAKIYPEFELVNALHLSNCKTGEPMHAWANGKYFAEKGEDETLMNHLRINRDEANSFISMIEDTEKDSKGMLEFWTKRKEQWKKEAEQVYQIIKDTPADLTETVAEVELDEFDEPDKVLALSQFMGCHFSQVEEEGRNEYTAQGQRYLVVTDSEADQLWDEDLENYIDDCILPEVPESARNYFDRDKWKSDTQVDGRGHSLGRYDGCENEEEVDSITYYIYRE